MKTLSVPQTQFDETGHTENGFICNTVGFSRFTSHTDVSMHSALKHHLHCSV